MVALPPEIPVTTPVLPTVATDGLPEDQVPPATVLDSVEVALAQKVVVPEIEAGVAGNGLTVTLATEILVPHELVTV